MKTFAMRGLVVALMCSVAFGFLSCENTPVNTTPKILEESISCTINGEEYGMKTKDNYLIYAGISTNKNEIWFPRFVIPDAKGFRFEGKNYHLRISIKSNDLLKTGKYFGSNGLENIGVVVWLYEEGTNSSLPFETGLIPDDEITLGSVIITKIVFPDKDKEGRVEGTFDFDTILSNERSTPTKRLFAQIHDGKFALNIERER